MSQPRMKMFQPLKDLPKYLEIVHTKEKILYECPIFLKVGENEGNTKIKYLRLHETFMLLSSVNFTCLSNTIFSRASLSCNSKLLPLGLN